MTATRLKMLWPPRITWRGKTNPAKDWATDCDGRRYGDYRFITVSFGHVHFKLTPKHVRGISTSIYWREANA